MKREKWLIDVNALNWGRCPADAKLVNAWLSEAPTVDAVEVVNGRWVERKRPVYGTDTVCSVCGTEAEELTNGGGMLLLSNYCPHCGAKMNISNEVETE